MFHLKTNRKSINSSKKRSSGYIIWPFVLEINRHVLMWQSVEILNVFNTLTLKQVFWKMKSFSKKLEYIFFSWKHHDWKHIIPCIHSMYKELIWCINYSNVYIHTSCKRWSFIWECFFPVKILKVLLFICSKFSLFWVSLYSLILILKLTLLIFTVIIIFVIIIIIIMIKKFSLFLDFYNPAGRFLPVTWDNREYFKTVSIFIWWIEFCKASIEICGAIINIKGSKIFIVNK